MAITRTNLRMTDTAVTTPLDWGATGDNTVDDTSFLQTAINDSSYSIVDLQGKTYRITSTLTCNHSNKTIRNGTIRYDGPDTGNKVLTCSGVISGTSYTLDADTYIGDDFVSLSSANLTASGIVAGDWVLVANGVDPTSYDTSYRAEDMVKVWYTTADKVYFTEALSFKYRTAESSVITKIDTIRQNITIDNITFKGRALTRTVLGSNPLAALTTGDNPTTVRVTHAGHSEVVGGKVYLEGAEGGSGFSAGNISYAYAWDITNTNVDNYDVTVTKGSATDTNQFGGDSIVAYSGATQGFLAHVVQNLKVTNCIFEDIPEKALEVDWVHTAKIENNKVGNGTLSQPYVGGYGISTEGGRHLIIKGNIVTGRAYGISIGSAKGSVFVHVTDNILENINYRGIHVLLTSLKTSVRNNFIRMNNWVKREAYPVDNIGIQAYNYDCEITDNRIEGAGYTGIMWIHAVKTSSAFGGGTSINTDMPVEYPSSGYANISGNTIHAPRDTDIVGLTPAGHHYGIMIQDRTKDNAGPTAEGTRIVGNFVFGYSQSIALFVNSAKTGTGFAGFKNWVIGDNILMSTPKPGWTKNAYSLGVENDSSTQEMALYRLAISNNIFDARGASTDHIDDQPLVSFYDAVNTKTGHFHQSTIGANIFNWSTNISQPTIKFSASASDNTNYPSKISLIGNVIGKGEASSAVAGVLVYDSGLVSMPGKPLGTHSADTGTMWGLNVWNNIENSEWSGTP